MANSRTRAPVSKSTLAAAIVACTLTLLSAVLLTSNWAKTPGQLMEQAKATETIRF